MLIIQKYGGSSVADAERVFNVAGKIAEVYEKNNDIVVVLSAQGGTTDELVKKAAEVNENAPRRELDVLLSTGEQQSVAIMAMALHALGLPAVSLTAGQAGIFSTPEHGGAKITYIQADRIKEELKNRRIVLIAGFQGIDEYGDITTLGRGASDTTAIALASVLDADFCEIYTDVDGIYTADPRIIKNAMRHRGIDYDEMQELASMGAKVLHNRSVELAKKFGVEFDVRSSLSEGEPTRVSEGHIPGLEEKTVAGITADRGVCKISVSGIKAGSVSKILALLAKRKIIADLIVHSLNGNGESICFSVSKEDCGNAVMLLEENKAGLEAENIFSEGSFAKLSVIGTGIAYDAGITAMFYETLYAEGIDVYLVSLSGIKISALVDENAVNRAISAMHARFAEAEVLRPQIN